MNKKFFVIFLVSAVGAVLAWQVKHYQLGIEPLEIPKKIVNCDNSDYVRLSFFNTSNHRVSLSIPSYWEGKYRLQEEGDSAKFLYLQDDGKTNLIFSIEKKLKDEVEQNIVCELDNQDVVFQTNNLAKQFSNFEFENNLLCIKDSVKCY